MEEKLYSNKKVFSGLDTLRNGYGKIGSTLLFRIGEDLSHVGN